METNAEIFHCGESSCPCASLDNSQKLNVAVSAIIGFWPKTSHRKYRGKVPVQDLYLTRYVVQTEDGNKTLSEKHDRWVLQDFAKKYMTNLLEPFLEKIKRGGLENCHFVLDGTNHKNVMIHPEDVPNRKTSQNTKTKLDVLANVSTGNFKVPLPKTNPNPNNKAVSQKKPRTPSHTTVVNNAAN